MRKSEQIGRLEAEVSAQRTSIAGLIAKHDDMVLGYREQMRHLDEELSLYTWAFSIACGKLMAHSKTELTPDEFIAELLDEAKREMGRR